MDNAGCITLLNAAFEEGTPVARIDERSKDAPFILEGEEFDLEWREVLFATASLPQGRVMRPNDFAELLRYEAGKLTLGYPPLVLLAPTEFDILDGWHRIAVAQTQRTSFVTLLVAKVPEIIPA